MKKQFALAIYANEAESDDELTFKKNDILQIIQLNYLGMDGWWLCKILKTKQTGLAAGNRLKIITDEKLLAKINSVVNGGGKSDSRSFDLNSTKSNSIISSSSSTCSVLSSNSSTCSNNSYSYENSNQSLSLQPTAENKHQEKQILPAKLTPKKQYISTSKTSFITDSTENILNLKSNLQKFKQLTSSSVTNIENDDDDYDYDIPANKPVERRIPLETNQNSNARKSVSPTIDSGISTSSLMSINADKMVEINSNRSSMSTKSIDKPSDDSTSSTSSGDENSHSVSHETEFNLRIDQFNEACAKLSSQIDLKISKETLFSLKDLIYEFLINCMKRIKEENACFHPNLNVFNEFKTYYRHLKEFYLYIETTLKTITNVYQWNEEIIKNNKEQNEFNELIDKIEYFKVLIKELDEFVEQSNLLSYHSEISVTKYQTINSSIKTDLSSNKDYEYEYDNNQQNQLKQPFEYDIYEKIDEINDDYSDYCQIDDSYENVTGLKQSHAAPLLPVTKPVSLSLDPIGPLCMTLRKNEEKIKREIRLAADNSTASNRINLVDQMLLKFYLKHIEENLNELNGIYESLMNKLINNEDVESDFKEDGCGHKLAINGHKLVFICDTLERNLNNTNLKTALYESSTSLSESLKIYMIRIKTTNLLLCNKQTSVSSSPAHNDSKQKKLIVDSLKNVLAASNKFKQIIIKYYFKSY